ncbi:hypothetical protein QE152_g5373 [Popillia japonica]|uniref:Uncharacterized protein n=1 Tax=Popillia japonica TaxID=7064 RepID=A0AAW1MLF6_POPJA
MQIYAAAIEKHLFDMHEAQTKFIPNVSPQPAYHRWTADLFDMHEAQTKFIPNVSPQPAYHRWTAVVSKGGNSNANVKSMDRMGIESYELGISYLKAGILMRTLNRWIEWVLRATNLEFLLRGD